MTIKELKAARHQSRLGVAHCMGRRAGMEVVDNKNIIEGQYWWICYRMSPDIPFDCVQGFVATFGKFLLWPSKT